MDCNMETKTMPAIKFTHDPFENQKALEVAVRGDRKVEEVYFTKEGITVKEAIENGSSIIVQCTPPHHNIGKWFIRYYVVNGVMLTVIPSDTETHAKYTRMAIKWSEVEE